MYYYVDQDAKDFEFWAGALDTVQYLTADEIEDIFNYFLGGEKVSATEINDLFWFESAEIAYYLGYELEPWEEEVGFITEWDKLVQDRG